MPTDWYPSREAERRLFLQNFVDTIDDAADLMKAPKGTYDAAKTAAQAELDAFGVRDNAQKVVDTAQTTLNNQEKLTGEAVRAAVKQIKNTMNVPKEVLDLLEVSPTASKAADRVGAEAPVLKVKMDGIHPSIGCVKHGFDAVEIWPWLKVWYSCYMAFLLTRYRVPESRQKRLSGTLQMNRTM